MKLQLVDVLIIAAYLVIMIVIGLLLKKKASKNLDSYFLGGKTLPFYMLGLSNASGMFDISGTMWMVYLAFVYGLKSLWIPWLWPVFNPYALWVWKGRQSLAYHCSSLCCNRCTGLFKLRVYRDR